MLFPLLKLPGMISLGGGLPNPGTFPFSKLAVDIKSATDASTKTVELNGPTLNSALQYSATSGLPNLVEWVRGLQERVHGVPADGSAHQVTIASGSQDAMVRLFEMVLREGDTLLVEDATYTGALAFLEPLGSRFATVQTDGNGMIPESLEQVLNDWSEADQGPRPRVLYTVPTGSNPTGASLTSERVRAIYEIARRPENNLFIIEDDPYYFLRFNDTADAAAGAGADSDADAVGAVDSFLSVDVDQRVARLDSFSKVLAAGLRLGYCTASPQITKRLQLHMQVCEWVCGWLGWVLVVVVMQKQVNMVVMHVLYSLGGARACWQNQPTIQPTEQSVNPRFSRPLQ